MVNLQREFVIDKSILAQLPRSGLFIPVNTIDKWLPHIHCNGHRGCDGI
jgi:hypothetical protein